MLVEQGIDVSRAPRRVAVAREYLLALGLSALVAAVTDGKSAMEGVLGASRLFAANGALSVFALGVTGLLQWRWPGPQSIAFVWRFMLIISGVATVWFAYEWIYPLALWPSLP